MSPPTQCDSHSSSPYSSPEPPHELITSSPSNQGYFGHLVFESSDSGFDCDDEDAGAQTDSTLDDAEDLGGAQFGHPLERIPRVKSADHGLNYDSDAEVNALLRTVTRSSGSSYPSRSQSVASFMTDESINFDRIVDLLLDQKPDPFLFPGSRNLVMFDSPTDDTLYHYGESLPPLMVKRLKRSSAELLLLLELNLHELREDPWNSAPHILRAVERDDKVYLCMQRLSEYNQPPLVNVAHYIDFFRQVLEGLSFLHEQRVVGLNCASPSSYMMDSSSASQTPAPTASDDESTSHPFDRSAYPVRYYFVDFTQATRIPLESLFPSSSPATPSGELQTRATCPFKRDVQGCGSLFERLLDNVPPVATKFKSLTKAMVQGGFTADDARRLFEALCRSIDAEVFEKPASRRPSSLPERAQTIAHVVSTSPMSERPRSKVLSR
ncbi:hypothetical protein GALMADRAFT_204580 [Galerina marginata CBS 339.88]|uniref:Protein kinase domain-containing protein n=1 Tax=Galerina marginata (strain CBS 339.88) TaxID=685588 RepID=A0A067TP87_GALM3|nr:hypothetical protein GALMADRAFT_204580 [Galerina marginata CBS 339.88]